jgi:hypothetical protein
MGLPIEPKWNADDPETWKIEGCTDSDWCGDKDTRKSVTAYEMWVNEVLIDWKSRLQRTVALSSTEAECVALCEVCQEILYIRQLIESMGMNVKYPIIVHVDNVGAMSLANNESTQRTKHIDVKCHFIRELVQPPNPIIKLEFVPTEKNRADAYSKNLPVQKFQDHFWKHTLVSPNENNKSE